MDAILSFFQVNAAPGQLDDLFLTILNMSGTGAVVICVVLLLRLALKRAPKKYSYWLWSAAAFRLVCPVSWKSVFSIFSLAPAQPVVTASERLPAAGSIQYIPPDIGMMAQPRVTLPIPQLSEALNEALPAADPLSSVNPMQVWTFLGAWLWLLGLAALLTWGVVSYARLARRLRTAVRLEEGVFQSEAVGSPFLMGYLRPRIYIPYGLEGERLDYVLAHERFHIARRDYLVKLLAFLILAVHWFNPLAWLAFYLMGRDMELRCDEAVLGRTPAKPADYSETLLSFAAGGRFPRPGPLAFGETGVKARIKNALRWRQPRLWVTVAAAILVILAVAACAANPADRPRETPAEPGREETDAEEGVLLARLEEIPVSTRDSVLYCVVRAAGSELRYTLPLVNAEPSPEPRVGDLLEIRYRGTLPQTEPMEIPAVQRIRVVTEAEPASAGALLNDVSHAGLPFLNFGDDCAMSLLTPQAENAGGRHWDTMRRVERPWGTGNARHFFYRLNSLAWRETAGPDAASLEGARYSVQLETADWSLCAYEGLDTVRFTDPTHGQRWMLPEWRGDGEAELAEQFVYQMLRGWYDEAEFAALGLWVGAELVIPDRGQTPEEAAREFGDALAARGLLASPGSQFRNTYETAVVTDYEPFNRRYDESGYVDGHQWRFLLELIFVPENERALHYQMAGNTHEYTGGDPSVPAGAYACTRCCYVVREADGWHGVNCGTAW